MGMEWPTYGIDKTTGNAEFHFNDQGLSQSFPEETLTLPVTETPRGLFSTFAVAKREAAGTTIVVQPLAGGSIHIVDLLMSGQKFSAGSMAVQFTDGTNTEIMFEIDLTDVPIVLGIPLSGRWQGWKDARFELVTVQDPICTVSVGYVKHKTSQEFALWDSLR